MLHFTAKTLCRLDPVIACVRTSSVKSNDLKLSLEFKPLEIRGLTNVVDTAGRTVHASQRRKPLHNFFPETIDWTNVWPATSTFHYSLVPFPIRQGYCKNLAENGGVAPEKYANTELMKIPNFLHLTKAHIKKHCAALKKFCTEWPSGLQSDQDIERRYPLEVLQRSYVFSAPSIRDPRSRTATIKFHLSNLCLDTKARRKFLRLAIGPGPGRSVASYDWDSDVFQLNSSRCPTSRQNYDYLIYTLTVLTLEAKKIESWELENPGYDWNEFTWEYSAARKRLLSLLGKPTSEDPVLQSTDDISKEQRSNSSSSSSAPEQVDKLPMVLKYREALETLWAPSSVLNGDQWSERPLPPKYRHNPFPPILDVPFEPVAGADNQSNLEKYAEATRQLFGLASSPSAR